MTVADVDLNTATSVSTLILAGVSIVMSLVGIVAWLDRRIESRISPVLEAMRQVREDIQTIQRNQLHIAERVGLRVVHRPDGAHVIDEHDNDRDDT